MKSQLFLADTQGRARATRRHVSRARDRPAIRQFMVWQLGAFVNAKPLGSRGTKRL